MVRYEICMAILMDKGRMNVWICDVSTSRLCVCYSTHHPVMSQARDDFEGFLKSHMTQEEKVIVQVETSLCAYRMSRSCLSAPSSLTHSLDHSITHSLTDPHLS